MKIGVASSLVNRINELQTGNPRPLLPLYVIRTDSQKASLKIEKQLHTYFLERRTIGEWFDIKPLDIERAACLLSYQLTKPVYEHNKMLKINKVKN